MRKNLIWTLKQVYLAIEQYGKIQMKNMDLSLTQGMVLHYLLTHREQNICGVDLHTVLGISKSSVSSTLKVLKQKGYLDTSVTPLDDRKKQIVLTEKAYDAEQLIDSNLIAQHKRLCEGISEQRLEWFQKDLDKMLCNLQQEIK